jgi:plastocyanin
MKAACAVALAVALGSCTPNGQGSGGGGGVGGGVTHTVDLNLTVYQNQTGTPYGPSIAIKPAVLNVAVGDTIVFTNADGFAHTSTILPVGTTNNETQFPSKSPINGIGTLNPQGATLSGGWTSGALQAGASYTVLADKAGTYLYGCHYHYSANMRGAIVAQ